MQLQLTPYGNLVMFLALLGASTLVAMILWLTDQLLMRFTPVLKQVFHPHRLKWPTRRLRKHFRPMTEPERRAMLQGMQEALDAFKRAEIASQGRL